jgi:hypothetical protein
MDTLQKAGSIRNPEVACRCAAPGPALIAAAKECPIDFLGLMLARRRRCFCPTCFALIGLAMAMGVLERDAMEMEVAA